jgi:hypothetical protein
MKLYSFTLPFFIALVLMLSVYTYSVNNVLNPKYPVLNKTYGKVLGASTVKVANQPVQPTQPVNNDQPDNFVVPPVQDINQSTEAADTTETTGSRQVIRNADNSFTEIEHILVNGKIKVKVTEREPTGEVRVEHIYDLQN